MANKNLFRSIAGKLAPKATSVNEAGGRAYALTPKQALAQFASTGCLSQTFYASAEDQLAKVLALCEGVEPAFIRPSSSGDVPLAGANADPSPDRTVAS